MEVEEMFQKLRPFLGQKIDALWLEYQLNPKRRTELEGFLHLLAAKYLGKPYISRLTFLDPPPNDLSSGDYPLGSVLYGDKLVGTFGIRHKEWIQHVGIFGRTGSGKTNVGFLIVESLMDHGIPVLIFDWKRNYRDLLQRRKDIVVHTVGRDLAKFAFNPLIPPPGTQPSVWLKKLIEIICHVYWLGEGVAYLLQEALDSVYQQFGIYENETAFPTLQDVKDWLAKLKPKGRQSQWMDSTLRAIGTLCYGEIGHVLNVRQAADLGTLLRSNAILELDALTNSDKTFLIQAMLLWIHHYRLQESNRETLKHAIIIEEAHHILLKRTQSKETIMDIILREIRELGESIVLIDQHPSLISIPSLGNTHTTIAMNLKHGNDVSTLGTAMLLDTEQRESLGKLPVGHAIVRLQSRWYTPFLVRFPEVEIVKAKIQDSDLAEQNLGFSAMKEVMLPRQQEKKEMLVMRRVEKLSNQEIELLKDVMVNISSGVAERYSRLGFSSYLGNRTKDSLAKKGLIEPVNISTPEGRVVVLWLTEKGKETLKDLGFELPPRGRGGPEHEFWKDKVAQHLLKLGYEVKAEFPIGGGKTVDLLAIKNGDDTAVEIETGMSDIESNIKKDIEYGVKKILVLVTDRHYLSAIENRTNGLQRNDVQIRVRPVSDQSLW